MSEAEVMEASKEGSATPSCPSQPQGEGLVSAEGECGYICLDKSSYSVGETAVVTWEMVDTRPHQRDFIGMFEMDQGDRVSRDAGHVSMERLLDSRLRGDTSLSGGRLQWHLAEDIFPKCEPRPSCQDVQNTVDPCNDPL